MAAAEQTAEKQQSEAKTPARGASPSWKDRALGTWREAEIKRRVEALIETPIGEATVVTEGDHASVVVDGITFILGFATSELRVMAPCPSCGEPSNVVVETFADLGKALGGMCKNCAFLVQSGLAPTRKSAA